FTVDGSELALAKLFFRFFRVAGHQDSIHRSVWVSGFVRVLDFMGYAGFSLTLEGTMETPGGRLASCDWVSLRYLSNGDWPVRNHFSMEPALFQRRTELPERLSALGHYTYPTRGVEPDL